MAETRIRIKPKFAIFCDDIRREFNGKDILIGVYSGGMILKQLPAPVAMAIWFCFERNESDFGQVPIELGIITFT
jgi:hypothetical protein